MKTRTTPYSRRKQKGPFEPHLFSDDQLERLFAVAGDRYLTYLGASCADLRLSELKDIKWDDIILDSKEPNIELICGHSKYLVPLSARLVEAFKEAIETKASSELVFPSYRQAVRQFHRDLENAGIPIADKHSRSITFLSLRRTFAEKVKRHEGQRRQICPSQQIG